MNEQIAGSDRGSGGSLRFVFFLFVLPFAGIAAHLVYTAWTSGPSGSLQARGALGSFSFQPDRCRSGLEKGFHGVELFAEDQPQMLVRVLWDVERGGVLVIERAGSKNYVLDRKSCPRLTLVVNRGEATDEDSYPMDGAIQAECSELVGAIQFARCM